MTKILTFAASVALAYCVGTTLGLHLAHRNCQALTVAA